MLWPLIQRIKPEIEEAFSTALQKDFRMGETFILIDEAEGDYRLVINLERDYESNRRFNQSFEQGILDL